MTSDHAHVPDDFAEADLLRPIERSGPGFRVTSTLLLMVLLGGWVLFSRQILYGLGVTGLTQPVVWGFYIVNFVFFIGISHAGTLISAILRLSKAEWRRPITRMAEVITVVVLAIGGFHPVLDMGRPERMLNIFTAGRLQSPLLWDVSSITAYFMASTVSSRSAALFSDRAIRRSSGSIAMISALTMSPSFTTFEGSSTGVSDSSEM